MISVLELVINFTIFLGVDAHVDTNIGKHMTALGNTLTTLTGFTGEDFDTGKNYF